LDAKTAKKPEVEGKKQQQEAKSWAKKEAPFAVLSSAFSLPQTVCGARKATRAELVQNSRKNWPKRQPNCTRNAQKKRALNSSD